MKRLMLWWMAGLVAAALFPALSGAADDTFTIPAGSTLHVRLTTTITSKTNKTGDPFTGAVSEPILVNGQEVIPKGSLVAGHVAFVKPSGRIKGRAQMRVVVDSIETLDDNITYNLSAGVQDAQGGECAKAGADDEGTIQGCGKSKKDAAKAAGIAAAMGAGAGATVGMASAIDCRYYGNCGGPGMGTSVGYGAGIGAGAALVYSLFKHEKDIVLPQGSELTFVVNRTVKGVKGPPSQDSSNPSPQ
jgi:hypothetical protein